MKLRSKQNVSSPRRPSFFVVASARASDPPAWRIFSLTPRRVRPAHLFVAEVVSYTDAAKNNGVVSVTNREREPCGRPWRQRKNLPSRDYHVSDPPVSMERDEPSLMSRYIRPVIISLLYTMLYRCLTAELKCLSRQLQKVLIFTRFM